jgi:hypothetical protein
MNVDQPELVIAPGASQQLRFSTSGWGLNLGRMRQGDALVKIQRGSTLRLATRSRYFGLGKQPIVNLIACLIVIGCFANMAFNFWFTQRATTGIFSELSDQSVATQQMDDELREERYLQGRNALLDGDYGKAREYLYAVGDYKEAADLIRNSYYNEARRDLYRQAILSDNPVKNLAVSVDGARLFTWDTNGRIACWDSGARDLLGSFTLVQNRSDNMLRLDQHNDLLLLRGNDLVIVDTERCELGNRLSFDGAEVVLNSSGSHVLLHKNGENTVHQLSVNGELGPTEGWPLDGVYQQMELAPDGQRMAVINADQRLTVLSENGPYPYIYADDTRDLEFSMQSDRLAVLADQLQIWDVELSSPLTLFQSDDLQGQLVFSPDDTRIAAITRQGEVRVWNTENGNLTMIVPATMARDVIFSPDSQLLIVGDEKSASFWKVR